MGAIRDAISDAIGKKNETQIKEQLELLLLAAKGKILAYKDEINEQFLNPASIDKIQIPGIRSIRFIQRYHVAASSGLNQTFLDYLEKAVDAFFSIGDGDNKGSVKKGIQALISGGLEALIGSTEAGEMEQKMYMVIPENNAFVRIDIAVWRYQLSEENIISNNETAIAYVLCKSVVDHTKVTLDELIYLTSEALAKLKIRPRPYRFLVSKKAGAKYKIKKEGIIGEQLTLDTSGDSILLLDNESVVYEKTEGGTGLNPREDFSIITRVYQQDADSQQMKIINGGTSSNNPKEDYKFYKTYLGQSSSAPSIQDTEAYIEELIKIWKQLSEEREEGSR